MHRSSEVIFISAGMESPKKRDHQLIRRQLYLNYGALSLATLLHRGGYKTALVHGEHDAPEEILGELNASGRFPSLYPIMLSIPSFYALSWAQRFCKLAKAADPDCKIVVGGRWVVGPDTGWLQSLLPEADKLVPGLSEPYIEQLLTGNPVATRLRVPVPGYALNHRLIDGYEKYQPSIEASRGCGMGCVFCEERDISIDKLGDPRNIVGSLISLKKQYSGDEIRTYFQSSMFLPTPRWASALANEMKRSKVVVPWRTETRVDVMEPETLTYLAEAGLRVIDLGLETASPTQILAMNKSSKPDRYLRKAEALINQCQKSGVLVKINILLYAGETIATFDETRSWLDDLADRITGVSVGPVIAYGPPRTADILINDWKRRGARPVDYSSAMRTGITKMHLSTDFDAESAESASLDLSRRFMDSNSYYKLKSFTYYPRNYRRVDFENDLNRSDHSILPFRIESNADNSTEYKLAEFS